MRVAIWNLERPCPTETERIKAVRAKIAEINADLWILTETHDSIDLSGTHHGATTAPSRRKSWPGESCATIWSRWPILRVVPTSDPTEATCVEIDHPEGRLLVYGSIIAYHGYTGPDHATPPWEEHYRFIDWQGADWRKLRQEFPLHRLITGGDYNQNRDGAVWYGTEKGRTLLSEALASANLACVTEEDFVASGKLFKRHSVNHLCVDGKLISSVRSVGAWENETAAGFHLSDHNGVWVDLASEPLL